MAIIMAVILNSSSLKSSENLKTCILQADKDATISLLKQSANIISNRLKVYGLAICDISIQENKGQIKVQLPGNTDLSEIEGLLISKGNLAFYEMLTLKEMPDFRQSDPNLDTHDGKIGCSANEDHNMEIDIENYLKSHNLLSSCKLSWGVKTYKSLACLYILKTNKDGNPLLTRSDIESIKSIQEKDSKEFVLQIKFVPPAVKIWADATRNNMNKPIAIVLNDKVYETPVVKTIMEGGLCEITGNMNQKEVNYFLALVNNDNLPISLSIIK